MRVLFVVLLVAFVFGPARAQDLGELSFPNSGSEAAQAPFLRGMLLLHSFEYVDARGAFQEARRADPDFAMAAWGEAMTHNHPIWMRQDTEAGRAILLDLQRRLSPDAEPGDALAPLASAAGLTPRERAYLRTATTLFFGDVGTGSADGFPSKEARDDAYAIDMARLAAEHPDDLDAQAFYALALLGTAHEGRDFTTYMRAAAVLEEVFADAPRHPGAAHYLIHAYDDPVHAPLGLRPARVYADVAPAASHALHMPSHIYLALGMWDDVATMNERSYEAAKAGTDRRGAPLNNHGWHALYWWHYAEVMRGDQDEAARLADLATELAGDAPDRTAEAHLVRIHAQQFVLTGDLSVVDFERTSASLSTTAVMTLANVQAAMMLDNLDAARAFSDTLAARVESAADAPWHARAASLMTRAMVIGAQDDGGDYLSLLEEAAALEAAAPLTFGPPSPPIMAGEMLGRVYLNEGRYADAVAAYEAALVRAPGRRPTLRGLEIARGRLDAAAAASDAETRTGG